MKNLFLSFLLLTSNYVNANTYYVDATLGNDSYTTTQAQSSATPWKTIAKVNSSVGTGSTVLFKKGETFYGSIIPGSNNINYGSYGTGAIPVITGLTNLQGWVPAGDGTYYVTIVSLKPALNIVTINGVAQEVGRYPNSDSSNGGYLRDSLYVGNTQFTASGLSGAVWNGAEVVARPKGYIVERNTITSQIGNTINYAQTITTINPRSQGTPAPTTPYGTGFGLFIQRDIKTLNKFGEWYFNTGTNVLSIYFGGANPASYITMVSTIDTLINCANKTNILVDGLDLEGANLAAIFFSDGSNIAVKNCVINNSGAKGVFGWNSSNTVIDGNTVTNSLCGGIDVRGGASTTNLVITNNTVRNTAMFKGMSSFYDPADSHGIYGSVLNTATISHNTVDSTGYNGIKYDGVSINVDSNFVNHYCAWRNDGGGIYAFRIAASNSNIRNNIITNGVDASIGTNEFNGSQGIYMDGGQGGVNITKNTIVNIPALSSGLFFNSPKNVIATYNTVYSGNGWYVGRQYNDSMFNFTLKNNIIFNVLTSESIAQHTHNGLNTTTRYVVSNIQQSLQGLGAIDSNHYNMPGSTPFSWYYADTIGKNFTFPPAVDFPTWKSYTSLDLHTVSSNYTGQVLSYNPGNTSITYNFAGLSKIDLYGIIYSDSAIIPAWGSIIFIPNGQTPTANAGVDQIITLPTSKATLSGSGTAPGGTIASKVWTQISGTTATITNSTTYTPTISGLTTAGVRLFKLTVTNTSGASKSDTMQITVKSKGRIATGTAIAQEISTDNINLNTFELKIYPEPVNNIANLNIINGKAKREVSLHLSVTDMNGRVVKIKTISTYGTRSVYKLDMSELKDGYYLVTIASQDGQKLTSKVMKGTQNK
jgi:parallel beta-helix repeat protein